MRSHLRTFIRLLIPMGVSALSLQAVWLQAAAAQPSGKSSQSLSDYQAFGSPKGKAEPKTAQPPPPVANQPSTPPGAGPQTQEEVEKRIADVLERGKLILGAGTSSTGTGNVDPQSDSVGYRDQPSEGTEPTVPSNTSAITPSTTVSVDPSQLIGREMPRDPRFVKFREWYKNHAVVSLIVNGNNREHLLENLEKLVELRDRNNVILGDVAVIGGLMNISPVDLSAGAQRVPGADRVSLKASEFTRYRSALALDPPKLQDGGELIARMGLTYSPTWVVRYHGKDYIFEGNYDPARLFSRQGAFLQGEESR